MSSSDVQIGASSNEEKWLTKEESSAPSDLKPFFARFKDLHAKNLWFQLTLAVEEYMAHPASSTPQKRLDLYENLISKFSQHISHLRLVSLAVAASRQISDPSAAKAFLDNLAQSIISQKDAEKEDDQDTQEPYVFATMESAHFSLVLGDVDGTKDAMDTCGRILDEFNTVERSVHASYYRVCGDYYKVCFEYGHIFSADTALQTKAEYASYYKNSLLYLACIDIETDLTQDDRVQRARDLALSALLGDTIYNFGELLLHPILTSLQSSTYSWLSTLLFSFNSGDIGRFESLVPHLEAEPILAENQPFLRQKICLMALIESVFRRASTDRTLSFETIAVETRLPQDEVEHLVMKALSLKLIKGSIDQHAQLAKITWVQPRVLDKSQLEALQQRLNAWVGRVEEVAQFVKGQTRECYEEWDVIEPN